MVNTIQTVVEKDLEYICTLLKEEMSCLAGKKMLITGGAGFLGYYFGMDLFITITLIIVCV